MFKNNIVHYCILYWYFVKQLVYLYILYYFVGIGYLELQEKEVKKRGSINNDNFPLLRIMRDSQPQKLQSLIMFNHCQSLQVYERYRQNLGETHMVSNLITTNNIYSSLQEALNKKAEKGVLQGQRKLRKGLHGKRVVFFSSKKNGALMPCESRLEADNCLDLELDTKVVKYRTQPISFDLGQGKSYTPDSVHVDDFGSVIVREAKVKKVLEKPGLVERLTRIRKILFAQNIRFHVVTEKELQQQPRLENQKLLYRYANHHFSNKRLKAQAEYFREQEIYTLTLKEFRELCTHHSLVPQFADILILHGFAKYDETKILNPNSEISLIGGTR